MTFASELLLLLWVAGSILLNGIAPLRLFAKLRGIDLVGYGAAAGVTIHGIFGWAMAAAPAARGFSIAVLLALTLGNAVFLIWRGVLPELWTDLSGPIKLALGAWALLLLLCLGLLHVTIRPSRPLAEGIDIFKTPTTNVKVQYLTSLPADNYIPFAVSEFFLRGISFQKERPLLPRAEVSNRTVLMSLVAVPFRVILGARYDHPELGAFRYLNHDWPDVSKLNANGSFEQFSVVGLVLNSLLLLGAITLCASWGAGAVAPFAALLYVTNPYFIGQTIYTWPKALAGFFILLAWCSIRATHRPAVVAALLGLAFHAHPYALAFAGWVGLFYLVQWWRRKSELTALFLFLVTFIATLVPWIVWTRYVLQIPSDLIAQNFSGPGTEMAWNSPMNFIWMRVHNLFYTVSSTIFFVFPFDLGEILQRWFVSLPGAVGLVLIYPALARCAELPRPRPWLWYGLVAPTLSILAIYSCPALPVLHGFQAPLAILIFFGVAWLSEHCNRRAYLGWVALQFLLNLAMLVARGLTTGVEF
ncbi:MAG TPA: hypothetical protein VH252_01800 [Chthoniobacterales bacterium]|jgi:hypothetical protein|nr:hypothetical protein [Chthoniobacterales bacterium]